MLRIATKTKLNPEEIIKRAVKFFGPEGYKLKIGEKTDTSVSFEGSGGSVGVIASTEKGKTNVELFSEEWDFQVQEFINTIH